MPSLVTETITTINRDSGLSHNQMAYRLALMMEKYPPQASIQPNPVLDTKERDNIITEMRNTLSLSQNAQTTEEYRRSLKDKYLQEYRQKFSLVQAEKTPLNNSTRVDKLVAERKKTFLEKMLQSKGRNLPLVNRQQPTPVESEQNQTAKKSLIPALMNIIVTRGIDTNDGRVYEGNFYRLHLLMRQGMQRLNVWRKSDNQSAFSAYKVDGKEEYKVIHNNLSPQETQKLINFNIKQREQQSQPQPQPQPEQNNQSLDGPEMD
ncbi:hypothetical protein [Anabaena azotica]|uniref:Uncharacterized protein n=1 Tax=Anabaena azotica FACHB-119 TaxID=947527 RepID=A0ABR8DD16_9NOST|nr:hypothetical protein [Anabaena azotica]MBD2504999.1 hypothetical protein [Anabaena azotica FACHB-119]